MPNHNLSSQRGSAIVVALFVMSLAAAAAVAMMIRLNVDIDRTELMLNANQANLYAEGSVLWAIDQLNNDAKNKNPQQLVDKTPIESKVDNINGYTIKTSIEDYQSYFNINSVTADENMKIFIRLLSLVEPKLEPATATNIAAALRDWISPTSHNNSFEDFYEKSKPPYLASHHPMTSISELLLVSGVSSDLFNKLAPYISALPTTEPSENTINVNNAPMLVLMSLSPSLSLEAAQAILEHRQQTPFINTSDFSNFDVAKNASMPEAKITIISSYFLVKTSVTVGQQTTILYSLLRRGASDSKPKTIVLWQTKGTL